LPNTFRVIPLFTILLLSMLILSCRSDAAETPTPGTVQPVPTAVDALPTVEPTSTTEPAPTAETNAGAIDPVPTATGTPSGTAGAVSVPVITTVPDSIDTSICIASVGNGSHGTAPGPTPIPDEDQGDLADADPNEIAKANATIDYLIESLGYWSHDFESRWTDDISPGSQAEALIVLESRMATLCGAAKGISKAVGLSEIRAFVIEALRIRHAWAVRAIQQLLDSGDANVPEMNSGRAETHEYVTALVEIYEAGRGYSEKSDILYLWDSVHLRAQIPSSWLVSEESSELTLLAPIDRQLSGAAGLGPNSLEIGTGITVRAFGLPAVKTLESAVEQFGHLPEIRGVVLTQDEGILFNQQAVWWSVDSDGWIIFLGMTVIGQNLYFAEYACPANELAWCDESSSLLDRFTPRTE
jgi:hypothetical protein